jgi:hypothetical protein
MCTYRRLQQRENLCRTFGFTADVTEVVFWRRSVLPLPSEGIARQAPSALKTRRYLTLVVVKPNQRSAAHLGMPDLAGVNHGESKFQS